MEVYRIQQVIFEHSGKAHECSDYHNDHCHIEVTLVMEL